VCVGHNIFVGPLEACALGAGSFARTIHIWRRDYPESSCKWVAWGGDPRNLVLHYKDGESLGTIGVPLDDIAAFFAGNDSVLVHCMAGQTRSATIAVLGKLVRGASLRDAVGDVVSEVWLGRRLAANIVHTPLRDILLWAKKTGRLGRP